MCVCVWGGGSLPGPKSWGTASTLRITGQNAERLSGCCQWCKHSCPLHFESCVSSCSCCSSLLSSSLSSLRSGSKDEERGKGRVRSACACVSVCLCLCVCASLSTSLDLSLEQCPLTCLSLCAFATFQREEGGSDSCGSSATTDELDESWKVCCPQNSTAFPWPHPVQHPQPRSPPPTSFDAVHPHQHDGAVFCVCLRMLCADCKD